MYRELSDREPFGTDTGPYAGPVKSFELDALPAHVRKRFVDAFTGEGEPRPLLVSRPVWLSRRPVVYLFPLDVAEIHGRRVRLTPMGHLRKATIVREGRRKIRIELAFVGGEFFSFPVANERAAETEYANIVHAQRTLKGLSVTPDLGQSVALDPFFALRSDPAWERLVARPHTLRNALSSRRGLSAAIGFGLTLGAGMFFADRATVRPAHLAYAAPSATPLLPFASLSPPALPDFPSAVPEEWPPDSRRPRADLTEEEAARRDRAYAKVWERYAAHATPRGKSMLNALLTHADRQGDPFLFVDIQTTVRNGHGYDGWDHDEQERWPLRQYAQRVAGTFGMALSQDVPHDLLDVRVVSQDHGPLPKDASVIGIHVTLTRQREGKASVVFTVSWNQVNQFTLTMPPPDQPLVEVRDKSLFSRVVHDEEEPLHRQRLLLGARAFDRLYDELFGLFFTGDPIVPW